MLTDIRLQNYRSYTDSSFELSPGVNIVVGPNTAGKSNLIEALLLSANNTTYRGVDNLIKSGENWARIDTHHANNEQRTLKLQPEGSKTTKTFEVDGKSYSRLPFSLKKPVVLFEPNNLFLLHAEPSARRDYIDGIISQTNQAFSGHNRNYKRALAQRNALLKQTKIDPDQLFVWSLRLSELAGQIVSARIKAIENLNISSSKAYSEISKTNSSLELIYKSGIGNSSNYSAKLLKELDKSLEKDKTRGFTSVGPHRDDIETVLNNSLASSQASRGEIRTIILSLKVLQLIKLEQITGKKPLFLLDDVFSELDGSRRKALTEHLKNYQTIITTTDADIILKNFSQKCQIIPL